LIATACHTVATTAVNDGHTLEAELHISVEEGTSYAADVLYLETYSLHCLVSQAGVKSASL
jgi:hypothetical protein